MADKNIPRHIAFIMDGNGRWAKKRLLPRKVGHKEGVSAMQRVIEACKDFGVQTVSFYAFSTENWSRPQDEIDALFALVDKFAKEELSKYAKRNFVVRFMGDLSKLPKITQEALEEIRRETQNNSGIVVNIGLNYGGHDEIVRAVNKLIASGETVSVDSVEKTLDTCGLTSPDIIARSAGEKRLSNFMLWQSAYSELIFREEYWPDFDKEIVAGIIEEFSKRKRKFGKIEDNG